MSGMTKRSWHVFLQLTKTLLGLKHWVEFESRVPHMPKICPFAGHVCVSKWIVCDASIPLVACADVIGLTQSTHTCTHVHTHHSVSHTYQVVHAWIWRVDRGYMCFRREASLTASNLDLKLKESWYEDNSGRWMLQSVTVPCIAVCATGIVSRPPALTHNPFSVISANHNLVWASGLNSRCACVHSTETWLNEPLKPLLEEAPMRCADVCPGLPI